MPLFEFVCSECNQPFEELVRSSSAIAELSCPGCGSLKINKKLSTFASKTSTASSFTLGVSSPASCNTGGT